MDPIALGIIGVVVAGLAWWILSGNGDTEKKDVTTVTKPRPEPVNRAPGGPKTKAKPTVKTLPGNAALNSLTKAALEDLGRDMGVELDKRKTKANMIVDLKAGVKK
jgi:hypothetical protein